MIVVIIACIFIILASFTPLIVIGIFNLKHKFYYDAYKKHPALEIKSDNEEWSRLPITHNGRRNGFIQLKKNPDKNDSRPSYISTRIVKNKINSRKQQLSDLKIRTIKDLNTINQIIDNNQ